MRASPGNISAAAILLGSDSGLVSDSESVTPKTEVIGVIPDRKYRDLKETPPPQAYFPYLAVSNVRGMTVYVRTQGDPAPI